MFDTWFYERPYCTDSNNSNYQEENNWRYVQHHHKRIAYSRGTQYGEFMLHAFNHAFCINQNSSYIGVDGKDLHHQRTLSLILGNMVQAQSNSLLANLILYWWYSSPLLRTVVSDHSSNHSYLAMVRMVIQDFPGAPRTHMDNDDSLLIALDMHLSVLEYLATIYLYYLFFSKTLESCERSAYICCFTFNTFKLFYILFCISFYFDRLDFLHSLYKLHSSVHCLVVWHNISTYILR